MLRALDLVDDPRGHVGPQPLHRPAVMRLARRPAHPEHRGHARAPSRRTADPHPAGSAGPRPEPARQPVATPGPPRSAVPTTTRPPCGRRTVPPLRPGPRPSPATAEPSPPVPAPPDSRRNPNHGIGGSNAPMVSNSAGSAIAAPITTSPPRLCPIATTGRPRPVPGRGYSRPSLLHHGQQVLDMPAQAHNATVPRPLVPTPVVCNGRHVGQPPHDPAEAVAPVQASRARTRPSPPRPEPAAP